MLKPFLLYEKLYSMMYQRIDDGKINAVQFMMNLRNEFKEEADGKKSLKNPKSWWFLNNPESLSNPLTLSQVGPDPWIDLVIDHIHEVEYTRVKQAI